MNAQEIIERIRTAEKKTPVRVFLQEKVPLDFPHATVFPCGESKIVFGDWKDIQPVLEAHKGDILHLVVESDGRNSAIPLLDTKNLNARIEPGAIIRDDVEIGDNAVVMMGAVINIGAVIGPGTMIDMGAVLGGPGHRGQELPHRGRHRPGRGWWSPPAPSPWSSRTTWSSGPTPWSWRAAGWARGPWWPPGPWWSATWPPNTVVAGVPAKVLKTKDGKTADKTALVDALREL